jgi:hypothetical protein
MLTYKSTLVKTKLYCIVHQQSFTLLYVLSLPLVHPNNVIPTTVLSASASQRLAHSQSYLQLNTQTTDTIISSWPRKPKRHEVENHELKHEHSYLQYCICNSSFNTKTICSFCNSASVHTKTQRICERKKFWSSALSCTAWIWHF